jgi:coenzyme Q-binding protein COQ10
MVQRSLPYDRDQLFDLAADVERYPEFLRWWKAVRVWRRESNRYCTDQVLGLGPLRVRFESKTALQRPERIEVTSDQGPFLHFQLAWSFEPQPANGCIVSLAAELDFRSRLLERIVAHVLPGTIADIIAAFEARAHELYRASGRSTGNVSPIQSGGSANASDRRR